MPHYHLKDVLIAPPHFACAHHAHKLHGVGGHHSLSNLSQEPIFLLMMLGGYHTSSNLSQEPTYLPPHDVGWAPLFVKPLPRAYLPPHDVPQLATWYITIQAYLSHESPPKSLSWYLSLMSPSSIKNKVIVLKPYTLEHNTPQQQSPEVTKLL